MRLDLTLDKLSFLVAHLDWSLIPRATFDVIAKFIEQCERGNNHQSVIVPYQIALASVKTMLNVGITQFEHVEHSFESL